MKAVRRLARGFTLIELLIAVAIFAILGVMAYSGLNVVLNTQERTQRAAERLQALQFALRMLERDLRFLAPRPVRNAFGDLEPALEVQDGTPALRFTHAAVRNPAALPRANLQRVTYLLDDDTLVRVVWTRLDGAPEEAQVQTPLLTGLDAFQVRVLTPSGNWTERWPPTAAAPGRAPPLPRAVEVLLESEDWGEIHRVIPLAAERPARSIPPRNNPNGPQGNEDEPETGDEPVDPELGTDPGEPGDLVEDETVVETPIDEEGAL